MPAYILYHMDSFTGHIVSSEALFASDDVGAVHAIQQRTFERPVELWREGRKIFRLDSSISVFRIYLASRARSSAEALAESD